MRLETPEIVDVLARPEQVQRGENCRLVAAARGLAYAREQTAEAVGVANVRRRDGVIVHECVPERDVPRLERVDLGVEVLAAAREPQVVVGHARKRFEGLRRAANSRRTADERSDILDVQLGR